MDDADRLSFLGVPCPTGCRVRTVILQPGDSLDFRADDWLAALVVVETGELEVECRSGACARFGPGAVLGFEGLAVCRLHSTGCRQLVLSALSRVPEPRARPAMIDSDNDG
jgi:hypothetical protein